MDSTKQVLRTDHAAAQAFERYGFVPNWGRLLEKIQRHEAKLIALSEQGRLIYDVDVTKKARMRVVVDATRTYVITVLPNEFGERDKRIAARGKRRKQDYFRGFEHDENEVV